MLDLRKLKFPKLKEEDCSREKIRSDYLKQQCRIAVKNLSKNNFEAHFCESAADAKELLLSLIPENSTVGFGDSHTIFSLELDDDLEKKNCVAIPHTCAVNKPAFDNKTPGFKIIGNEQETREILMNYLVSNVFILGANAVTMDGQIINIDGSGNRVAGSCYGSDRIIIVAGANKLVKDLNTGMDRIHDTAAQMNNIKYHNELACNKSGRCLDCRSEVRYCNITNIIHRRPTDSDFHVIMIAEELGF